MDTASIAELVWLSDAGGMDGLQLSVVGLNEKLPACDCLCVEVRLWLIPRLFTNSLFTVNILIWFSDKGKQAKHSYFKKGI